MKGCHGNGGLLGILPDVSSFQFGFIEIHFGGWTTNVQLLLPPVNKGSFQTHLDQNTRPAGTRRLRSMLIHIDEVREEEEAAQVHGGRLTRYA